MHTSQCQKIIIKTISEYECLKSNFKGVFNKSCFLHNCKQKKTVCRCLLIFLLGGEGCECHPRNLLNLQQASHEEIQHRPQVVLKKGAEREVMHLQNINNQVYYLTKEIFGNKHLS